MNHSGGDEHVLFLCHTSFLLFCFFRTLAGERLEGVTTVQTVRPGGQAGERGGPEGRK